MIVVAGMIGGGMVGTLYASANMDKRPPAQAVSLGIAPEVNIAPPADEATAESVAHTSAETIPEGMDPPEELLAALDAQAEAELAEEEAAEAAEAAAATTNRRARRTPRPAPLRLHPNAGLNVIAVARQMNARGERIQGSCYRYISEIFSRAGYVGWRNRQGVFRGNRNGPYANLNLMRPGDWLYIVNHPERTPVGTHSVLFVGWQDRARGYARVIEHPGWGSPTTGRERGYDVSRTFRITRPINR